MQVDPMRKLKGQLLLSIALACLFYSISSLLVSTPPQFLRQIITAAAPPPPPPPPPLRPHYLAMAFTVFYPPVTTMSCYCLPFSLLSNLAALSLLSSSHLLLSFAVGPLPPKLPSRIRRGTLFSNTLTPALMKPETSVSYSKQLPLHSTENQLNVVWYGPEGKSCTLTKLYLLLPCRVYPCWPVIRCTTHTLHTKQTVKFLNQFSRLGPVFEALQHLKRTRIIYV